MRIGTNHGSLSARILSYYGDTPRCGQYQGLCQKGGRGGLWGWMEGGWEGVAELSSGRNVAVLQSLLWCAEPRVSSVSMCVVCVCLCLCVQGYG